MTDAFRTQESLCISIFSRLSLFLKCISGIPLEFDVGRRALGSGYLFALGVVVLDLVEFRGPDRL
jgi:hypothetical protein